MENTAAMIPTMPKATLMAIMAPRESPMFRGDGGDILEEAVDDGIEVREEVVARFVDVVLLFGEVSTLNVLGTS